MDKFDLYQIEKILTEILVEKLGVEECEVVPEASITFDLGADSLDAVEIIMDIEKVFEITIPDEIALNIATVGDAIDYISQNCESIPAHSISELKEINGISTELKD